MVAENGPICGAGYWPQLAQLPPEQPAQPPPEEGGAMSKDMSPSLLQRAQRDMSLCVSVEPQ